MGKYAINEEFLQQIETLELILKNNVAGIFGGNHQSKNFGSSCEFADYRDYIPGDDITKIDWNAYARFEHLYLKQYLDERRLHTKIYIDASRSMDFGKTEKATKTLQVAAAFAYLSIVLMDKVSIYYVQNNKVFDLILNISDKDTFYNSINKLNEIEFTGDFLFSEGLSKEELNPTIRGKIHYFDSETATNDYRKFVNKDVVKAYHEAVNYITTSLSEFCYARGANYLLVPDNKSINQIFMEMFVEKGVLK